MNSNRTRVIADGHVHVYPAYDVKTLFRNLIQNLDRLARKAGWTESGTAENGIFKLAFLAESRGYDFFSRLQNQDKAIMAAGLEVENTFDPVCITVGVRGAAP